MKTPQLATIDDALIERVRNRVVEACHPQALYLFGSAARGEARRGSDLDLLVVMDLPKEVTPREQSRTLHALFDGWLLPLDIIVKTPEAFAEEQRLLGFISRVVRQQGVLLYGDDPLSSKPSDG